jgi:hypothetical protein
MKNLKLIIITITMLISVNVKSQIFELDRSGTHEFEYLRIDLSDTTKFQPNPNSKVFHYVSSKGYRVEKILFYSEDGHTGLGVLRFKKPRQINSVTAKTMFSRKTPSGDIYLEQYFENVKGIGECTLITDTGSNILIVYGDIRKKNNGVLYYDYGK